MFDNPTELLEILDSSGRPDWEAEQLRKQRKVPTVDCEAFKLDQVADWKAWAAMLGVRLKGLSSWDSSFDCEGL